MIRRIADNKPTLYKVYTVKAKKNRDSIALGIIIIEVISVGKGLKYVVRK